MKEALSKEVSRIGSVDVDHSNLGLVESVSMTAVAILAVTIGTSVGSMLF